jgi:predicted RNA-binding protein with PUA-like domain
MPNRFLVKSEPDVYPWDRLVAEKRTVWDGVRNFQARNNLRLMKKGDLVLFYHSGDAKEVVGIAKVVAEAYADSSAKEGDWSAVDLAPVKALKKAVPLSVMKVEKKLADLALLRQSRLSVVVVSASHFAEILKLGETKE